jgi:hypothetical protein
MTNANRVPNARRSFLKVPKTVLDLDELGVRTVRVLWSRTTNIGLLEAQTANASSFLTTTTLFRRSDVISSAFNFLS